MGAAAGAAPQAQAYELTPAQASQFARNDPSGQGPRLSPEEASNLEANGAKLTSDAQSKVQISDLQAENAKLRQAAGMGGQSQAGQGRGAFGDFLAKLSRTNTSPKAQHPGMAAPPPTILAPDQETRPLIAPPAAPPPQANAAFGSINPSMQIGTPSFDAPLTSDKTTKEGAALGQTEPAKFMDHLKPYAFNYKPGVNGEDPSDRHFGVMAQDVAKSPMGASIVDRGPQGLQLDTKHGFGTALAALGNLNARLRELEGKRGKR